MPQEQDVTNIQFKNVGNLGDILKHGALVNLMQEITSAMNHHSSPSALCYIDFHTFLAKAPFPQHSAWEQRMKDLNDPAYDKYIEMQCRAYEHDKQYLCSSGMAMSMIDEAQSSVKRCILSEQDEATRQKLQKQIDDAPGNWLSTDANKNMKIDIMHHSTHLDRVASLLDTTAGKWRLLCLVDPFVLDRTEWEAIQQSLARQFPSDTVECAAMIVFTYDRDNNLTSEQVWKDFRADKNLFCPLPVATIHREKFHLAVFSSDNMREKTAEIMKHLQWDIGRVDDNNGLL